MAEMTQNVETVLNQTTYARQDCPGCGLCWYWPEMLDNAARNNSRGFWCPGCGTSLGYHETEADRLRKSLATEQERVRFARNEADRQRDHRQHAERRVNAMKGVVTKTKKRIAAGKCVRCSCEFPDLANHMAEAHPDYKPDVE